MARQPVFLNFWVLGINSLFHPAEIAKQQYAWGENIINRGGLIQTRPGRRPAASILGTKAQGFAVFAPKNSTPRLVAAVDGFIYVMTYPSFTPVKLEGIQMNANVSKVHFCKTRKSLAYNADGSLKVVDPTPVLMISDGVSRTAYWDGSVAAHLDPVELQTPICTWMAWLADRLWMAYGSKILVSDLADPLSHREATYLNQRDGFYLSGECTGLIATPNRAGILAFTEETTTAFKASITDRGEWASTPDFQDEILQDVGNVSGRSACNQYGTTHWMSKQGLVSFDVALQTAQTNKLTTEDEAMLRSRRKLSPDQSGVCSVAFGNMMFVSVPSGSKFNSHTWVMDQAPVGSKGGSGGAWASIWTGIRPVQWAKGKVGGKERLYSLCFDKSAKDDTRIHIWEEMLPDRTDAGGRIKCQWITGGIGADSLVKFKFAQFEAAEILGDVRLNAFVCGSRGPWYPIGTWNLQAEEGCFGSPLMPFISSESIIEAYKPQGRALLTREFTAEGVEKTSEHRPYSPGVDRTFQLCFEWTGKMGIRQLNVVLDDGPPEIHGTAACIGEDLSGGELGQHNAILETGENASEQP